MLHRKMYYSLNLEHFYLDSNQCFYINISKFIKSLFNPLMKIGSWI